MRRPGDVHAALQSEDCICLAVLDAPLRFTDWKFRWMNPFLKLPRQNRLIAPECGTTIHMMMAPLVARCVRRQV